jgi:hypothetical protein
MTPEEIKNEFALLSPVTDGAPETCNFLTVWDAEMSVFLVVDLHSLSLLSEENLATEIALIRSQLGVV